MTRKIEPKKLQPLTYKYVTLKGGRVDIQGLDDDEIVPTLIDDVLARYGFVGSNDATYLDGVWPSGADNIEHELDYLAEIIPVRISIAARVYMPKRSKLIYTVSLNHDGSSSASILSVAMQRAHKAWNKAGRSVGAMSFKEAMKTVLQVVNRERSK